MGALLFGAIAVKMVSRHPGRWSTYPPRNLIVLVVAWVITALLLGLAATRFERLRSWWAIGLGTLVGSFAVLGLMLFTLQRVYAPPAPPKFKSAGEMMAYLANEATKWMQMEKGVRLDYSVESIKAVEDELARISKEVDKANPQQGTFGVALGYGSYVGEVFRRRDGGSWAFDHPQSGPRSYPLTIKNNTVIFPVGWCWQRLTNGEEDNVYIKAMVIGTDITNATGAK